MDLLNWGIYNRQILTEKSFIFSLKYDKYLFMMLVMA